MPTYMTQIQDAINVLECWDTTLNTGRGVWALKFMLKDLRLGDLEAARNGYLVDGDKLRQYPGLIEAVEKTIIGCRLHSTPFFCPICSQG